MGYGVWGIQGKGGVEGGYGGERKESGIMKREVRGFHGGISSTKWRNAKRKAERKGGSERSDYYTPNLDQQRHE